MMVAMTTDGSGEQAAEVFSRDPNEVRAEARAQWGRDPAGSNAVGSEPLGTMESFVRVEADRYQQQPWMHETFRYERFDGERVLEIGVGLGTDHLQFARAGAAMTGVDLTPRCVELTRERFTHEGLTSDLQVMDAEALTFADEAFDVVYSFGVLHHIPSTEQAFKEVRRVLRPGGVFLGGLYSRESWFYARIRAERILRREYRNESLEDRLSRIEYGTGDAKPHVRLFAKDELRSVLNDAGFQRVRLKRRHAGLGTGVSDAAPRLERVLGRIGGWYLLHEAA